MNNSESDGLCGLKNEGQHKMPMVPWLLLFSFSLQSSCPSTSCSAPALDCHSYSSQSGYAQNLRFVDECFVLCMHAIGCLITSMQPTSNR